ncbi:hypothetical protein KPL71_002300 [Citrus sinensis]|uniref:Uncharacterized protein n=1 Tax=Citrus sinensis TaxID=2711 RepID=A0ACB8P4Z5_CITSI|nr:hypothetical protein KPL71_002300 [Citrus sinensis]
MGRRKLKIRRLESMKARQTKYSKRKIGILKKARELAVLCDTDLALLMFSPTGKPSLCVGQNKDLSTVLERLAKMSVDDREERNDALKLQQDQLRELKDKLAEKTKILREWKNPHNVKDIAQIHIMEEHLVGSLLKIRNKKRQLVQEQQQQRHEASDQVPFEIEIMFMTQHNHTGRAINLLGTTNNIQTDGLTQAACSRSPAIRAAQSLVHY